MSDDDFDFEYFDDFYGPEDANDIAALADDLAYYSCPSPVWELYDQNPGGLAALAEDISDWEYYSDDCYYDGETEGENNNNNNNKSTTSDNKTNTNTKSKQKPNTKHRTKLDTTEVDDDGGDNSYQRQSDTEEEEPITPPLLAVGQQNTRTTSTTTSNHKIHKRRIIVVGQLAESDSKKAKTVQTDAMTINNKNGPSPTTKRRMIVKQEGLSGYRQPRIIDCDENRQLVDCGTLYKIRYIKPEESSTAHIVKNSTFIE